MSDNQSRAISPPLVPRFYARCPEQSDRKEAAHFDIGSPDGTPMNDDLLMQSMAPYGDMLLEQKEPEGTKATAQHAASLPPATAGTSSSSSTFLNRIPSPLKKRRSVVAEESTTHTSSPVKAASGTTSRSANHVQSGNVSAQGATAVFTVYPPRFPTAEEEENYLRDELLDGFSAKDEEDGSHAVREEGDYDGQDSEGIFVDEELLVLPVHHGHVDENSRGSTSKPRVQPSLLPAAAVEDREISEDPAIIYFDGELGNNSAEFQTQTAMVDLIGQSSVGAGLELSRITEEQATNRSDLLPEDGSQTGEESVSIPEVGAEVLPQMFRELVEQDRQEDLSKIVSHVMSLCGEGEEEKLNSAAASTSDEPESMCLTPTLPIAAPPEKEAPPFDSSAATKSIPDDIGSSSYAVEGQHQQLLETSENNTSFNSATTPAALVPTSLPNLKPCESLEDLTTGPSSVRRQCSRVDSLTQILEKHMYKDEIVQQNCFREDLHRFKFDLSVDLTNVEREAESVLLNKSVEEQNGDDKLGEALERLAKRRQEMQSRREPAAARFADLKQSTVVHTTTASQPPYRQGHDPTVYQAEQSVVSMPRRPAFASQPRNLFGAKRSTSSGGQQGMNYSQNTSRRCASTNTIRGFARAGGQVLLDESTELEKKIASLTATQRRTHSARCRSRLEQRGPGGNGIGTFGTAGGSFKAPDRSSAPPSSTTSFGGVASRSGTTRASSAFTQKEAGYGRKFPTSIGTASRQLRGLSLEAKQNAENMKFSSGGALFNPQPRINQKPATAYSNPKKSHESFITSLRQPQKFKKKSSYMSTSLILDEQSTINDLSSIHDNNSPGRGGGGGDAVGSFAAGTSCNPCNLSSISEGRAYSLCSRRRSSSTSGKGNAGSLLTTGIVRRGSYYGHYGTMVGGTRRSSWCRLKEQQIEDKMHSTASASNDYERSAVAAIRPRSKSDGFVSGTRSVPVGTGFRDRGEMNAGINKPSLEEKAKHSPRPRTFSSGSCGTTNWSEGSSNFQALQDLESILIVDGSRKEPMMMNQAKTTSSPALENVVEQELQEKASAGQEILENENTPFQRKNCKLTNVKGPIDSPDDDNEFAPGINKGNNHLDDAEKSSPEPCPGAIDSPDEKRSNEAVANESDSSRSSLNTPVSASHAMKHVEQTVVISPASDASESLRILPENGHLRSESSAARLLSNIQEICRRAAGTTSSANSSVSSCEDASSTSSPLELLHGTKSNVLSNYEKQRRRRLLLLKNGNPPAVPHSSPSTAFANGADNVGFLSNRISVEERLQMNVLRDFGCSTNSNSTRSAEEVERQVVADAAVPHSHNKPPTGHSSGQEGGRSFNNKPPVMRTTTTSSSLTRTKHGNCPGANSTRASSQVQQIARHGAASGSYRVVSTNARIGVGSSGERSSFDVELRTSTRPPAPTSRSQQIVPASTSSLTRSTKSHQARINSHAASQYRLPPRKIVPQRVPPPRAASSRAVASGSRTGAAPTRRTTTSVAGQQHLPQAAEQVQHRGGGSFSRAATPSVKTLLQKNYVSRNKGATTSTNAAVRSSLDPPKRTINAVGAVPAGAAGGEYEDNVVHHSNDAKISLPKPDSPSPEQARGTSHVISASTGCNAASTTRGHQQFGTMNKPPTIPSKQEKEDTAAMQSMLVLAQEITEKIRNFQMLSGQLTGDDSPLLPAQHLHGASGANAVSGVQHGNNMTSSNSTASAVKPSAGAGVYLGNAGLASCVNHSTLSSISTASNSSGATAQQLVLAGSRAKELAAASTTAVCRAASAASSPPQAGQQGNNATGNSNMNFYNSVKPAKLLMQQPQLNSTNSFAHQQTQQAFAPQPRVGGFLAGSVQFGTAGNYVASSNVALQPPTTNTRLHTTRSPQQQRAFCERLHDGGDRRSPPRMVSQNVTQPIYSQVVVGNNSSGGPQVPVAQTRGGKVLSPPPLQRGSSCKVSNLHQQPAAIIPSTTVKTSNPQKMLACLQKEISSGDVAVVSSATTSSTGQATYPTSKLNAPPPPPQHSATLMSHTLIPGASPGTISTCSTSAGTTPLTLHAPALLVPSSSAGCQQQSGSSSRTSGGASQQHAGVPALIVTNKPPAHNNSTPPPSAPVYYRSSVMGNNHNCSSFSSSASLIGGANHAIIRGGAANVISKSEMGKIVGSGTTPGPTNTSVDDHGANANANPAGKINNKNLLEQQQEQLQSILNSSVVSTPEQEIVGAEEYYKLQNKGNYRSHKQWTPDHWASNSCTTTSHSTEFGSSNSCHLAEELSREADVQDLLAEEEELLTTMGVKYSPSTSFENLLLRKKLGIHYADQHGILSTAEC
ncbi:unnamed protein product [Amoebophrya sp. A120]|nr:unnamed protein product [Amoebophrya sp. A120]|eukprot:GSA120T00012521001.1